MKAHRCGDQSENKAKAIVQYIHKNKEEKTHYRTTAASGETCDLLAVQDVCSQLKTQQVSAYINIIINIVMQFVIIAVIQQ